MPWLAVTALYLGLTLAYAWPLIRAIGSRLPFDAGDPGLNAWILWWNTQAVPLTERWWNAPIFFPVQGAMALSETLLGLAPLTVPLQWAGASPILAYNIAFLLSFPAAALAAHALAYRLTGRHDAALLAGLGYGFSPYRAAQLPHLQVLWSCWMPLGLLGLHRYLDSHRSRFLVLAGVCWVLNGFTTGYFLMYFAVLVALWMLWFARAWREWLAVAGALGLASLAMAPVLLGYVQRQRALRLTRNSGELDRFAADLSGIWSSRHAWLPGFWTLVPKAEGELYPGVVILVLAVAGALVAWRVAGSLRWPRWRMVTAVTGAYLAEAVVLTLLLGPWHIDLFGWRVSMTRPAKPLFIAAFLLGVALLSDPRVRAAWRRRSALFFYVVAAIVMFVFALGPVARAFGEGFWPRAPYFWLAQLPGGLALRVPARFAMLFILCLTQAAALGAVRLSGRGRWRWPLMIALAAAVALEGWVPTLPTSAAPAAVQLPAEGSAAVLEVPIRSVFSETAAMLRGVAHGLPVVNGFSGYSPWHYYALREGLATHEPAALDALRHFGSILVLVHRVRDPDGREEAFVRDQPQAELVSTTELGPVYRLVARPLPGPVGTPLPIVSIQANVNPELVPLITDGRSETRWHAGVQAPGARLEIVLDSTRPLSRLELDLGPYPYDYPRELEVAVGDDDETATVVWRGPTAGVAAFGLLNDPRHAPVALLLPESTVGRRLVAMLTADHASLYWSVTGIRVFGR